MARIRTIKPEFWQDEDLASVSEPARLLAIGLLNLSDDEGYFNANAKLIQSQIFPITDPSVTIHTLITDLSNIGYILLIDGTDGKRYGKVKNFAKHQMVNRPKESKIKKLIPITDESLIDHGTNTVGREQGTGNREGKGSGKGESTPSENSENFIISFQKLKESLTGEIFQEQVCTRSGYDLKKFKEFVDRWLGQKEMTKDYMYPLPKMRSFLIMDFEKSLNGKGRFQPANSKPVNGKPGEYFDDSEFDENGMLKSKITAQ